MIQFAMWFILLSTLGVGGGIFFLLFAIVPIEEWYVQRGWSQFTIDGVMKYYVFGWVIFGFIASFVYYFTCLKKERWVISSILCASSILLCIAGMNYFLNTGSSVVQASQGEVVEGERFKFGPYPEKETLKELKEEGYDGVITLLSPAVLIEKPLLDKEIAAGEEVGIDILSMPMMPWVGDNTKTLNKIRELVEADGKRYYVHCYLGRHRVDVVKQIVNEASGEEVELLVLQSTSFERGDLYYDAQGEVLIGPYPTNEEWFTRVRRGEVKELVSLIDTEESFIEEGKKVAAEMSMAYTAMPISEEYELVDLQAVVDYVKSRPHKVFVYNFNIKPFMKELESLYRYGKTIFPLVNVQQIKSEAASIGASYIVGPSLTAQQQQEMKQLGIERFIELKETNPILQYKQLKDMIQEEQLTYVIVPPSEQQAVYKMLHGLLYGYNYTFGKDINILDGRGIVDTRNLTYGPVLTEQEIIDFIIPNGIKQVVYIYVHAITTPEELEQLKQMMEKYNIDFKVFEPEENYEKKVIPVVNDEQGGNYIMAHEDILPTVFDLLEKY